ncbi:MAG TPA: peptidylprolyl isomerase [Bacteroidales bacterium]|nr:peptidylprolyl isomerase [Bacteroidales bacterium]HQL69491.1 peptidylprolyl isomerase [Bacteroidales bacterium]
MQKLNIGFSMIFFAFLAACSSGGRHLTIKNYVEVKTSMGDIVIGLYESTPLHRDNFIEKCNNNFYDSLLVHKATPSGILVTGDPASKKAAPADVIGLNLTDTSIPAEIHPARINARGAVGAMKAPDAMNPEKKSHTSVFYIVYGDKFDEAEFNKLINMKNAPVYKQYIDLMLAEPGHEILRDSLAYYKQYRKNDDYRRLYIEAMAIVKPRMEKDGVNLYALSEKQQKIYATNGGLPDMDGSYTVFGRVVFGLDKVEAMTKVNTGLHSRPRKDIYILSTRVMTKKEWKNFLKEHHE